MKITLLCATRRGYAFLKRITELQPECNLTVFSFKEEPWEPPFLNDIRDLTLEKNGEFYEAHKFNNAHWESYWQKSEIDLMLAVNWRFFLSPEIYQKPKHGTYIFHDSLLPEYRGFSPTVWAMSNGEDHTGVTLFKASEKMDEGLIVDQTRIPIGIEDNIANVTERVTQGYLKILENNLDKLLQGKAPLVEQDHSRATYTCKRLPKDNKINWHASTMEIYNLIRAVTIPYTGAYTYLDGQELKIWSASLLGSNPKKFIGRVPGRVVEVQKGIGSVVLTGDGALLITSVQSYYGGQACAANLLNQISQTLG
jgi:methionyl-tRNA formyltransferase